MFPTCSAWSGACCSTWSSSWGTSAFFTGCDVVRTLRPAGLGRPLVYVVAWQQAEQTVLSLLECGVDQYMTFPVSLQRLRTKIANALNRQL